MLQFPVRDALSRARSSIHFMEEARRAPLFSESFCAGALGQDQTAFSAEIVEELSKFLPRSGPQPDSPPTSTSA